MRLIKDDFIVCTNWGVSWCCGNYCLLAFVLWCGYCSVSFQSFVLRHWCPQHQETTKNCGQVHDEYYAPECFYFSENRHRIRKKCVYHRKYHIINVMNDIAQKNNIQIGYYNRENILRIFQPLDRVTPDVGRKRLMKKYHSW